MYVSKYNVHFDVPSGKNIIFNCLSGALDFVNDDVLKILIEVEKDREIKDENNILEHLKSRGYIFTSEGEEAKALNKLFLEYNKFIKQVPDRFVLIPTYNCNLSCTYCYQKMIQKKSDIASFSLIDRMFSTIEKISSKKYESPIVMLFGGEPLLSNSKNREVIRYILNKCEDKNYPTKIISNGVNLIEYCDILSSYEVLHQVHITLDGTKSTHDSRRIFSNGRGTFDNITEGIDRALENGIRISIHVNLDEENIQNLPAFSEYIDAKGWWNNRYVDDAHLSTVQEGVCNGEISDSKVLKLTKLVFELQKDYPSVSNFRIDFGIAEMVKKLVYDEIGFIPRFKFCGANISMYVLDLFGDIYSNSKHITLGFDSLSLTYQTALILNNLDINTKDVTTSVLHDAFAAPLPEELNIIKRLSDICDKALLHAKEVIEPSIKECEIAGAIDKKLWESGITGFNSTTLVTSGPNSAFPHSITTQRKIQLGEPIIADISPMILSYEADSCRTFIIEPETKWKQRYEILSEIVNVALDTISPGVGVSEFENAVYQIFEKYNLPKYPHLTGHPIGGFRQPLITDSSTDIFKKNMVFVIEPAIYIIGEGGVRLECQFMVTSKGCELLESFPTEFT